MQKVKLKKYFDTWATEYDSYLPILPQYQQLVTSILKDLSDTNDRSSVLEAGIGTGCLAFAIYNQTRAKIYGIDISKKMIGECKKRSMREKANFVLKVQDLAQFKKNNNFFDAIVSCLALHHLDYKGKQNFLNVAYDSLKLHGKLILGEVAVDFDGNKKDKKWLNHVLQRWGYAAKNALKFIGPEAAAMEIESMKKVYLHERELVISIRKWKDLINDAKFKNIEVEYIDKKLGWCKIVANK